LSHLSHVVKLGHVANIKLDALFGDDEAAVIENSTHKVWFRDKRHLFSKEELTTSSMAMEGL